MEPDPNLPDKSQPCIVQINEPHPGMEYPITEDEFSLGRSSGNHLAFPGDDSISRLHARILKRLGLLWLEDMGSKNGSFMCAPGGLERRLEANVPAMLIENSRIRLGLTMTFEVHGTIASADEATRTICQKMQYMLLELSQRVGQLPPAQRKVHLDAIHSLEKQLSASTSEEEMVILAVQGFEKLNENLNAVQVNHNSLLNTAAVPDLPPLPEHLPDPSDPQRLNTIMNVFITDFKRCFPSDEDENHA